jgi:hypothetical protein
VKKPKTSRNKVLGLKKETKISKTSRSLDKNKDSTAKSKKDSKAKEKTGKLPKKQKTSKTSAKSPNIKDSAS